VHLADLPTGNNSHVDEFLNDQMRRVREIVTEGLQLRSQAKIKVRQPLLKITVKESFQAEIQAELVEIIKEELNIKEVLFDVQQVEKVLLDIEITPELAQEGIAREIVRHIQEMRKEAGFEVDNKINVWYNGKSEVFEKFGDLIAKETLSEAIKNEIAENSDLTKEILIDGMALDISIKKV
jgi:isoleucyl-tRNA synthetase